MPTLVELKKLASIQKIKGRSKMNKMQLLIALNIKPKRKTSRKPKRKTSRNPKGKRHVTQKGKRRVNQKENVT